MDEDIGGVSVGVAVVVEVGMMVVSMLGDVRWRVVEWIRSGRGRMSTRRLVVTAGYLDELLRCTLHRPSMSPPRAMKRIGRFEA